MEKTEFANGFYAELTRSAGQTPVLRLYTPDDICVASVPCQGSCIPEIAEGMMYGYFCGWRDCKRKIKDAVGAAMDRVGIVDIVR